MSALAAYRNPGWLLPLGAAGAAGAAAGLLGPAVLVLLAAAAACVAVLVRPREGAVLVGLASPLNNLAVLHVGDVLDLRFLQVLWLLLLLGLATRWALGRPALLAPPPAWFAACLAAVVGWQGLSMLVNGAGGQSLVEVVQLAGYAVIAWLVAASFGALPPSARSRLLLFAAAAGTLMLAASTACFALGLDWAYVVEASSSGAIDFVAPSVKVQEAAAGVKLVRMNAFNLSTVTTASVVACLLGPALAAALTARGRTRVLGGLLLAVCGAALLLTFSRAGWLVGAMVLIAVAWRAGPRRALVTGACLLALMLALTAVPQVSARFAEFSDPGEDSTSVHLGLWGTAIDYANGSPLFGSGPNSFVERTAKGAEEPAHNFVLEAAADTGWVGAGLVVGVVAGVLVWSFCRLADAPPLVFSAWTGLLGAVLMNLTMNGFREDMWWVWMGLTVSLAAARGGVKPHLRPVRSVEGRPACGY